MSVVNVHVADVVAAALTTCLRSRTFVEPRWCLEVVDCAARVDGEEAGCSPAVVAAVAEADFADSAVPVSPLWRGSATMWKQQRYSEIAEIALP